MSSLWIAGTIFDYATRDLPSNVFQRYFVPCQLRAPWGHRAIWSHHHPYPSAGTPKQTRRVPRFPAFKNASKYTKGRDGIRKYSSYHVKLYHQEDKFFKYNTFCLVGSCKLRKRFLDLTFRYVVPHIPECSYNILQCYSMVMIYLPKFSTETIGRGSLTSAVHPLGVKTYIGYLDVTLTQIAPITQSYSLFTDVEARVCRGRHLGHFVSSRFVFLYHFDCRVQKSWNGPIVNGMVQNLPPLWQGLFSSHPVLGKFSGTSHSLRSWVTCCSFLSSVKHITNCWKCNVLISHKLLNISCLQYSHHLVWSIYLL